MKDLTSAKNKTPQAGQDFAGTKEFFSRCAFIKILGLIRVWKTERGLQSFLWMNFKSFIKKNTEKRY